MYQGTGRDGSRVGRTDSHLGAMRVFGLGCDFQAGDKTTNPHGQGTSTLPMPLGGDGLLHYLTPALPPALLFPPLSQVKAI